MNFRLNTLLILLFFSSQELINAQSGNYFSSIRKGGKSNATIFHVNDAGNLIFSDWISPQPFHSTISGILNSENIPIIYTNGCYIFDIFHNPVNNISLQNGTELNAFCNDYGSLLNNSAVILDNYDNSETMSVIFTKGDIQSNGIPQNNYIGFCNVDIVKNEISEPMTIYESEIISEITITNHLNGRDYWIAFADMVKSNIIVSQICDTGMVTFVELPFEFFNLSEFCNDDVQLNFSNDGNKLLVFAGKCFLSILDFDRCSGYLNNMRINLNLQSNIFGKSACFTADDKYIIVEKEHYRILFDQPYLSKLEIYETSKVGINILPTSIIEMPEFYSKGKLISYSNKGVLVFNQFGAKSFINISFENGFSDTSLIKRFYIKTPSYLGQAISKNYLLPSGVNECISSVFEYQNNSIKIFPNPAQSQCR